MDKPYYQDSHVTIYHKDCRDMSEVEDESVDLVLTDPPYGIGEAAGKNRSRGQLAQPKDYGVADWDNKPIEQRLLNRIIGIAPKCIIFGGNFYNLPPSSCWYVWDKDNSGDFADCELAWTNLRQAVRLFRYRWNGMLQEDMKRKEYRWHPTQKPLALMKWCIIQAGEGINLILDPFLGSGTTAFAAKSLNCRCIGYEIEEKYCEIAANRCRQMEMELSC